MEGVLLIATIAEQWQMRLAPGQRVAPQPMITLRAKNGIRMRVERRESGRLSSQRGEMEAARL
jgi:hypothetical protein